MAFKKAIRLWCFLFFLPISSFIFTISAWSQPVSLQDLYEQATTLLEKGSYQQAEVLFEQVNERAPTFGAGYFGLALARRSQNAPYDEVVWLFNKAVDLQPEFTAAYEQLCRTHYAGGQFEDAIISCSEALNLNPDLRGPKETLAWVYLLGKSDPGRAIPLFEEILEAETSPAPYYGLGLAYLMANERSPVLEIITNLRFIGSEEYARKLEHMIQTNDYVVTSENHPLVSSQRNPPAGTPHESTLYETNEDPKGIRVRLKGKLLN